MLPAGQHKTTLFPSAAPKPPLFFWGAFSFARASFPLFPLSGTQIRQLGKSASCHCPQIQACHAAVRAESCAVGFKKLFADGIRVNLDDRSESVNYKIREAIQDKKVPYVVVVGDKEIESGSVAVRKRGEGPIGTFKLEEFAEKLKQEIKDRV